MSVESTTTIAGLNALWPQGTDVKAEGDDHIRLIKSVLKAEFPTGSAGTVIATAQTRNRICNGAMQISQETGGAPSTANGYCPADQWSIMHSSTAVIQSQRVTAYTPNGSDDRLRFTINTADAALAAGGYATIRQMIEGVRITDFKYGTAQARQAILRFGWKSPAGTYSIRLLNGPPNDRSYVVNFTVTAGQANIDTEQVFVIPGATATGTWAIDTSIGTYLDVVLACGTTYQAPTTGWSNGAFQGTSANSNGMATAGAVYELFDVGLYLDPNGTGVPPAWVMPDEAEELVACRRYWQSYNNLITNPGASNESFNFPVSMRIAPAITGTGGGFTASLATEDLAQLSTTARAVGTATLNARM